MKRNLDGVYFRVERNGKFESVCFSDLTNEEKDKVCEGRSAEWFKNLAFHLAERLKDIGESLDIACED
jgi:hypothetical protein